MTGTVVVTGASTGIGRATAEAFHAAGFDVVATMRDPGAGEGLPCRVEALDVTDDASVARLFSSVGPVDVLVNNAGIGAPGSCEDTDMDFLHRAMDTNFSGAVRCTRQVLPQMRERGEGCLLFTTSVAGRVVMPFQSAYHASKFALEGWAETLAYEMAPFGVRVAIIEPGFVLTPIFTKDYPQPSATYAQIGGRLVEFLLAQARHGTMPDHVAQVMVEAATTTRPKLRWMVGPDALRVAERMDNIAEDELMAMYREPDDHAFWATFQKLFGPEVTPERG